MVRKTFSYSISLLCLLWLLMPVSGGAQNYGTSRRDSRPVATKKEKKPADLEKFLNQSEVMFDGEVMKLDEEDRQEIRNALEFIFYKAKKKNKRKK